MPNKIKSFYLMTNRQSMVFDDSGKQMPDLQAAVTCYSVDLVVAAQICEQAEEFFISKWREWMMPITRLEMQYLLGLRTRELDIADNEARIKNIENPNGNL